MSLEESSVGERGEGDIASRDAVDGKPAPSYGMGETLVLCLVGMSGGDIVLVVLYIGNVVFASGAILGFGGTT